MRVVALIPFVLSTAALVIGFLCLFAGDKPNFMSDYEIVSLNTSRIGQNLIQSLNSSPSTSNNPITNLLHNITSTITGAAANEISTLTSSLAKKVGIADFYTMYALDYCSGYYIPGPVPNATLSAKKIHMNVTFCSPKGGHFNFTPGQAIQQTLDETHTGITLDDLDWPKEIDEGVQALHVLIKAFIVLYSIAIGLAFITMIFALVWLLSPGSDSRRGCAGLVALVAFLAFLMMGIASGLGTAVGLKADHVIDKYGAKIGISAGRSNKWLALTWAGVACLLVASLVGCVGICIGGRRRRTPKTY